MKLYQQAGTAGLYQISLPMATANKLMLKYLPVNYGDSWIFGKNNTGSVFLQADRMEKISKAFFEKKDLTAWRKKWKLILKKLKTASKKISKLDLKKLSNKQLLKYYKKIFKLDQEMWTASIFIDSLDAGFDNIELNKIASKYKFNLEEVQTLISPTAPSYITEWEIDLYKYKTKKLPLKKLINKFFWYAMDYSTFHELNSKFINANLKKVKKIKFESPIKKQKQILAKYKLKKNPLEDFQILAQWRDERKCGNYMGLYGLIRLLREELKRQKISPNLVNYLHLEEAESVFLGKINKEKLQKRTKQQMLIHRKENGNYTYLTGNKALKKYEYLKKFLPDTNVNEIKGMIASPGIIKGTARIIPTHKHPSAKNMQQGDILITSMTRPEFLPLMKKASAIVTDEGGISCHAAIVSREMSKPCVIGTKVATKLLHDNDLVEVDANKGIIKILKKHTK